MALELITDHAARALSRVVTQLRGTEFEALVRVFAAEIQTLEAALFSVLSTVRNPSVATAATLDALGRLVGAEERGLLVDADYRMRIGAAIVRNAASAQIEQVISLVLVFFGSIASETQLVVRDVDEEGVGCATITWATFALGSYQPITAAQAEELMRYLSRAAATRVIFSYAPTFDYGVADPGALAKFDTAYAGFDITNQFAGSVDHKTKN